MSMDETEPKAMVKKAAHVVKDHPTLKVPVSQFIFQCIDKASLYGQNVNLNHPDQSLVQAQMITHDLLIDPTNQLTSMS